MEDHEARQLVGPTIKALEHAWDRGDGAAFAAKCTADVDFINLLGMHVKGRQAVAATHEKIFRGPYAASTLKFGLEHVRPLSNDGVLAIVSGELKIPGGEVRDSCERWLRSCSFVTKTNGRSPASRIPSERRLIPITRR